MKTVAIVQARMGSTRFPGKIIAELCGQPMIAVLLHRLHLVSGIDEIVVATTNDPQDNALVELLSKLGTPYFRGSEDDVLDRFWQCAKAYDADLVVRVTADDPLKDPVIIERALDEFHARTGVDYVSNTITPTYPEGLDIEVFSFAALDRAAKEANLPSEREHVTPYIWKNTDKFSVYCFGMQPDLSDWRWTVDKPEDLLFVRTLLSYFNDNIETSYKDVIKLLNEKPELRQINAGTVRNEGYLKSISMEHPNE